MKKKILVIGPGLELGGVERSLVGLLNSFDYATCDVDLFLLSHTGPLMPYIHPSVNVLPANRLFELSTWPITTLLKKGHLFVALIRMWAKIYGDVRATLRGTTTLNPHICKMICTRLSNKLPENYDLALGFLGPHYFLNSCVTAKCKVGWVHTDYSNSNEKPDTQYLLPVWKKLDHIACVSDQVKQSFDVTYLGLSEKSMVIENILLPDFIRTQSEEFNVESEMPDDGVVNILSVGRFCTAKAFDEIVHVVSVLIEKGYQLRWYLIGFGPDEMLIKKQIIDYKMEEYVIVLGKKSNPYPYMRACDLYVQPSRYEGKAVTVLEAQILDKPVMITRYATASSQLTEGVDGYICEMGVDGVVSGLEYLLQNRNLMELYAKNTANKKYDNSIEVEKLISLIE